MLSPVEEVKSRLDIIEVLSSYIKLQKAGANFRALCPFHQEKTPSFMISPARQMWHCFGGCNEGGDIFKFVMKVEGLEFGDALRQLANRAGVVLKKEDPRIKTERNKYLDICCAATEYFQKNLAQNSEVGEYLAKRGLKKETIEEFKIGYASESWDGLLKYLSAKNFHSADIEKAGLAVKSEKADRGYFDRFRGRIMFPVANSSGEIIGFGGRVFKQKDDPPAGGEAKYINSPQTTIYDKSRTLYGFDKAKMDIRKNNFTILVEGYMDLIMCHQAGEKNAVAVMGAALTQDHLQMLKRLSENIYTCFDMDSAGENATKRAIDMAIANEFNVKVITVPSGKDPADFILEHPDKWKERIGKAQNFMDFYFENILAKNNSETADGKKNISKILLAQIKKLKNKVEQGHWLSVLSGKLGIKQDWLEEEMARIKLEGDFLARMEKLSSKEVLVDKTRPKEEMVGERIIACILKEPKLKEHIIDLEIESILEYPFGQLLNFIQKTGFDIETAKNDLLEKIKIEADHLVDYANKLMLSLEIEEELESLEEETKFCVRELKIQILKKQLSELGFKIQKAEESRNEEKFSALMQEFQNLSNQLNQLLND